MPLQQIRGGRFRLLSALRTGGSGVVWRGLDTRDAVVVALKAIPVAEGGAAAVAGMRLGLLDAQVDVETRGGQLTIEWQGMRSGLDSHVFMAGPAETVFEGEIEL